MDFLTIFGLDLIYRNLYKKFTILDCCDFIGLRLLRLCFHKKLLIGGNCRFCLCSVLGERKYVIGCFYKIKPGIVIRHISLIFKYFKFLLFLILNHPTDCPLCDQVGICEIQNMFNVFGTALRVNGYVSSSFFSINCGFFLQFVMSRCIHCLRCVRFMREIVLMSDWGFFGRGKYLQVGLYVHSFLKLQIIDSLIKICPVGALTSRLFVFEVRNWEIVNVYFVNIYNCLVDYIMLNICNSTVFRVCALSKDSIFSNEWVLDNVKNLVYNSMYQRICVPFVNLNVSLYSKILTILSWNSVYFLLCCFLCFIKKFGYLNFVSVFLDYNLDIYSFFYIKKTFLLFNIYNFNSQYFTDLTLFFKVSDCRLVDCSKFWLLVGLEFETKFTTFGLKLKSIWRKTNLLIFCFGFFECWMLPVYFLGSFMLPFWSLLGGISSVLNLVLSLDYGVILLNSFIVNMFSYFLSMSYFFDFLFIFKKQFVWGVLSVFSNFVGNCFLNFTFKNSAVFSILKKAYFFFDNSYFNVDLSYLYELNIFSCYTGTYFNKLVSSCKVVLPLYVAIEKYKVLYMNIFGKLKGASRLVNMLTYVASDSFICFLFRNVFFVLLNDKHFGRWYLDFKFIFRNKDYCVVYSSLIIFLFKMFIMYYDLLIGSVCGNFMITDFMNSLVLQDVLQLLI